MILKLGKGNTQFVGNLSMPTSSFNRHAWLLCSPYGQEGIRTDILYRVLAERLVRSGHAVLRFDYYGCGNSLGEFGDRHLDHLVGDTLEAWEALRSRISPSSFSWFGLSLGANVAAMAAAQADVAPERLALWEPILDGSGYCERLLSTHREELTAEFEASWSELTGARGLDVPAIPGNVLGFEIGERFAFQLKGIRSLPLEQILDRGVEVRIATNRSFDHVDDARGLRPGLHVQETGCDIDWMTSEAGSTPVAPQQVVKFIMATGGSLR